MPEWLEKPAWGARFPACLDAGETVGQGEWAKHHLDLCDPDDNSSVSGLHIIAMNVFLGFYGFAVQAMLNHEQRDLPPMVVPEDPLEMLDFTLKMLDEEVTPVHYSWENPWS